MYISLSNLYFLSVFDLISVPPYLSPYAASKSYNYAFSRCLHAELSPEGFDVLAYTPAVIESNLSGQKRSFAVAAPVQAAKSALYRMRFRDTAGYWVHEMQTLLATSLPVWLLEDASRVEMKKIMTQEAMKKPSKGNQQNNNESAVLVNYQSMEQKSEEQVKEKFLSAEDAGQVE
jgi:short-subunit dehydrogenase